MAPKRRLERPAILYVVAAVAGVEKFRSAIWQFDKIVLTTQKLLRAAKILNIPVYVTTQNGARLGATVSELQPLLAGVSNVDKTYFSMWVPEISQHFDSDKPSEVVIVGIESHVCVTQTALDLLEAGHKVYVLADGVSSCNQQEVPIALARLRAEGATVTTSESFLFECMGDAGIPEFRDMSKLIKETSGDTKTALGGTLSKI
ncbi:isochorismatase domain-containing protein [Microdochium trichocladiopsis]|uniref:Isochorismatase domain-containing protein n=1 Tax=Microdochium trichocladiopsis TaxID=1682393 RepID=A0A9P8YF38_9PEZI|nr:isochorismatase domain-containing protein [Microdochium trichocladiopsis]KAH7038163.1 isochorismatase domain-containing protein [Microdochium trichocladiopsis]